MGRGFSFLNPLFLGTEGGGILCGGWRTLGRRYFPLGSPVQCVLGLEIGAMGGVLSRASASFHGTWVAGGSPACLTKHSKVDQPQPIGVEIWRVINLAEVSSSVRGVDIGQFQGGHPCCGGVLKQAGPLCLRTSWIQLAVGEVQDLGGSRRHAHAPFSDWHQLDSPFSKAGRRR